MDLPVVPGDELLWACGQIGQYAVAAPLVPFFVFTKDISIFSRREKFA
jgi:hypothetical protein